MSSVSEGFLPVCKNDMDELGWEYYDFLLVTGDAYVDHPAFAHAIISRVLTAQGYRVAILPQPDWRSKDDFLKLGRPRLGVLISGGNIDSMVNHYTAARKPRRDDSYSHGGRAGMRPDRCVIVYTNRIREAFGDIPVIIGGIEASLRRFAHYDYWEDRVRRSVLVDSRADLLGYGMGENQITEVADALDSGIGIKNITWIRGTCYLSGEMPMDAIALPSFEEVRADKLKYSRAVKLEYENQDPVTGKVMAQAHQGKFLVQNAPQMPLGRQELDRVYALPYTREVHPMYPEGVPAIAEVRFSITSERGCFGSCNFCALTFHQGRIVQSRSKESLVNEAKNMVYNPDFKGYIHDVGGPTANFRRPACKKQLKYGSCKNKRCLFPKPCENLDADHAEYSDILREMRSIEGIKKVFIRSGIRYDYLLQDKNDKFLGELCQHHVSGQLKVAPEHVSNKVLRAMGKPPAEVYKRFSEKFYDANKKLGKEQYLVPYLMSSHPGSGLREAIELAVFLKKNNLRPQQVQDFYPTPGTISTAMYHTGVDPMSGEQIYVPKTQKEKAMQRALLQFSKPENYETVYKALTEAGRTDLIGNSPDCLIRPRKENKNAGNNFRRKKGVQKNKGKFKRNGSKIKK